MRKITISTLLTLLYLAGTAQALRAQQTTEDASLPADSVGQERALTINEMRQQRGLTDTHNLFVRADSGYSEVRLPTRPIRTRPTGFWSSKASNRRVTPSRSAR